MLPREAFGRLVREKPAVAGRLPQGLAALVRRISERVIDVSTLRAHLRLHAELLSVASEAGVQGDRARIDPDPKHADLASQLNPYPGEVTRELPASTRAEVLGRDGRALVVLDVARLRRMAGEAKTGA